MKNLLLIALLAATQFAFGQIPPTATGITGFFGVPFGSTRAQVKEIMKKKGYNITKEDDELQRYKDVTFSDYVGDAIFGFVSASMNKGAVFIKREEINLLSTYHAIVNELKRKYPEAQFADEEKYMSPYDKSDGMLSLALDDGKANIESNFLFPDKSGIVVKLIKDNYIAISYIAPGKEKDDY